MQYYSFFIKKKESYKKIYLLWSLNSPYFCNIKTTTTI